MLKRRTFAAAVVAAVLLTGACTSGDEKSDQVGGLTTVGLGVIPIVEVAPVYLGKQKGFFSSRGIDLALVQEQGGAAIVKGVLAGKYQFGFSNVTSLMLAQADGAPLRVVANGVASTGRPGRDFSAIVVPYGSPVRSAKDLSGKRVAVNTLKNLGDTTVRQSVRKAGGNPKTVEFTAMPFSAMPSALQTGQIDAAWVVEPQLSESITLGAQVIASNLVDTAPNLTVATYFTGPAPAGQDPTVAKRVTEGINESLRYAAEHPDEVRAVVGTYTQITETVRIMMILPNWPSAINRASVERLAALGQADGTFRTPPALDKLLPAAG
ncbi:MAG TPA: ABC transporter substrate-binding protein [Actinoplanes sp.]|nr:ABC transporter substrate-binding protein [Actinoplanes sp.]